MAVETDRFGKFWMGPVTVMRCPLGCPSQQAIHHGELSPEVNEVSFECWVCQSTVIVRLPRKKTEGQVEQAFGQRALERGGPLDPDANHVNDSFGEDALGKGDPLSGCQPLGPSAGRGDPASGCQPAPLTEQIENNRAQLAD